MFDNIKNILVIKLRHIGDVLLTYPVYTNLYINFPNARILALVNKGTEEVIEGHPYIHEILTIPRDNGSKFLRNIKIPGELLKRKIDLVFDLDSSDRSSILTFLTLAKYRVAFLSKKGLIFKNLLYTHIFEQKESIHTVERNLKLLKLFGLNVNNFNISFHISEDDIENVKKKLMNVNIERHSYIHIHPVSRWFFKCWDEERWGEVINYIISRGLKVVITSSKDEREMKLVNNILNKVKDRDSVVSLGGCLTLKGLGVVSKYSRLFLGIDTAPMHIASAVGTQVVALFGGGINQWRPYGKDHVVIYKPIHTDFSRDREKKIKENLMNIQVKDVIDVLSKDFSI